MDSIKKYYESQALDWLKQGRVLFYQPADNTGFGNKLRGLVGAFVFALLSKRFFFMCDEFVHAFFESPFIFSWLSQEYQEAKTLAQKAIKLSPPLRPDNWSEKFWQFVSKELIEGFPQDTSVWYTESTSFYDALLGNKQYEALFLSFGMDPGNKVATVGSFSSLLLGKLRPVWRERQKQLLNVAPEMWRQAGTTRVGVQYRSFVDLKGDSSKDFSQFTSHLVNICLPKLKEKHPSLAFFLTTDKAKLTATLESMLKSFGQVWTAGFEVVLTGDHSKKSVPIWKRLINKLKRWLIPQKEARLQVRSFTMKDKKIAKQVGSKSLPILEWLVLGESDIVVSSFTSFAVFAAARLGNKAQLYKIDPRNDTYGRPEGAGYLF